MFHSNHGDILGKPGDLKHNLATRYMFHSNLGDILGKPEDLKYTLATRYVSR